MVNSKELVIKRIFNATPEIIWKAWTNREHLKNWWGPKTFTAPVIKTDLRIGGKYLFCMKSAEGQEYWSTGTYREIIPNQKLVCTDSFADEKGNIVPASYYGMQVDDFPLELNVTIQFEDVDGKTKMILTHTGLPAGEMREMTRLGWNESFDKLEESIK